jgi:FkbM family methyltransferase
LPWRVSRALDRLACSVGLTRKTIRARGFRVRIRRLTVDERFVVNVILNEEYTPSPLTIAETDTVVDIGANIGTFSLLAARAANRGRVLAFEPNPENYELFQENVRRNQLTNIVAKRIAVSGRTGHVQMFWAPEGGFHTMVLDRIADRARPEVVEAWSLKTIFDEFRIGGCHFLKLDCEGAEYEILYALPPEYFRRIGRIALEYHGADDARTRREQSDALVAFLETHGFRIDAYEEFVGFRGGFIRATNQSFAPAAAELEDDRTAGVCAAGPVGSVTPPPQSAPHSPSA